jgi:hypothetical protein
VHGFEQQTGQSLVVAAKQLLRGPVRESFRSQLYNEKYIAQAQLRSAILC